jgi:hypothetical protein
MHLKLMGGVYARRVGEGRGGSGRANWRIFWLQSRGLTAENAEIAEKIQFEIDS